ncbi:FkbM family methyltransferase [Steroidobacter cummioxidans]|uniref:FkbM family methyltransferase n=1 Tax=Steroidobacter cummioxidans TaxID=1803913 RepID=UPI000E31A900|nr:FkbM family methyltransferase [Steroidobacter cummioxidans]
MKSFRRLLLERLVAGRPRRALQLSCAHLEVCGVRMRVPQDSPLFDAKGGEIIDLPMDGVIAPYVLDHGRWQAEELDFLGAHLPNGRCVLIDVGANIGLITRQLMHRLPAIAAAVCYEPHPGNFQLLKRNLSHLPQCHLVQAAVGTAEGQLTFYEDQRNAGNYSLNLSAMRNTEYRTSVVHCLPATEAQLLAPLDEGLRLLPMIWKSDTQGFDELIMATLPDEFWARVHGGVMEISRVERPPFDRARLRSILAMYPIRRFGHELDRNVSVNEILGYAEGDDDQHRDLFFARA